jgi:hypothetical protein
MKQRIAMLLVVLALAVVPHALVSTQTAHAATICTSPKSCSTLAITVGRVWSEGNDPMNVTRYDVSVTGSGLKPGSLVYWADHMTDGTLSGGFAIASVSSSGRAKGTVSRICPSWFLENRPVGGIMWATTPTGEISERWAAPAC